MSLYNSRNITLMNLCETLWLCQSFVPPCKQYFIVALYYRATVVWPFMCKLWISFIIIILNLSLSSGRMWHCHRVMSLIFQNLDFVFGLLLGSSVSPISEFNFGSCESESLKSIFKIIIVIVSVNHTNYLGSQTGKFLVMCVPEQRI